MVTQDDHNGEVTLLPGLKVLFFALKKSFGSEQGWPYRRGDLASEVTMNRGTTVVVIAVRCKEGQAGYNCEWLYQL